MSKETTVFTINQIFREEYTKMDCNSLASPMFGRDEEIAAHIAMIKMIDGLGHQSACEQGLNSSTTNVDNLLLNKHILYILKDSDANNGCGELVAFLKMGYKGLFLYDEAGKMFEVEPLCVLDFFVVSNRQRQGHGRALLNYMLKDMDVKLTQLAFDNPTKKFLSFLGRHYGYKNLAEQYNGFRVIPDFFHQLKSEKSKIRSGPAKQFMATAYPQSRSGEREVGEPPRRRVYTESNKSSMGSIIHNNPENPSSRGYGASSSSFRPS